MAASIPAVAFPSRAAEAEKHRAVAGFLGVPWYIWCAVLACTSTTIGGHWDVSWHRSIGRDTFWTPAHMAIYLCGVLAGIAFGYLILATTFSKSAPLAQASVRIWGFRAPLGAFIAAWGGIAMLTSAPFDDWWHNAYGLDVKIVSPPHMVLLAGIFAVKLGTLVVLAGFMNRASDAARSREIARYLSLYICGLLMVMSLFVLMEFTSRPLLHNALPYIVLTIPVPLILIVSSRFTGLKYGATLSAALYTLFLIGLILILPLFPAEPKLGPVYRHVTQFLPPQFPILIIVPALLLDLLWQRTRAWVPSKISAWKTAAVSAVVFVASLLAVEWPFASFLMTPAAANRFFGTMYLSYSTPPDSNIARNLFILTGTPAHFWTGIAIALVIAALMFRWGISRAEWLRSIQR